MSRLNKLHDPNLIFLQETKLRQNEVEKIKLKLRFDNAFVVDDNGRFCSRGLLIV